MIYTQAGAADLKAIEDTGRALEAERERQQEADRVARRHSVRRQSSMTKPSAVAQAGRRRAGRGMVRLRQGASLCGINH